MKGLISRSVVLFLVVYIVLAAGYYLMHEHQKPEILTGLKSSTSSPILGKSGVHLLEMRDVCIPTSDGFILLGNMPANAASKHSISTTTANKHVKHFVLKLDSKGKDVWKYQFSTENSTELNSAMQMPNGDVVVSGHALEEPSVAPPKDDKLPEPSFIMRIDRFGKLVWLSKVSPYVPSIADADNGRVFVYQQNTNFTKVTLLDYSGRLRMQQVLGQSSSNDIKHVIEDYGVAANEQLALSRRIDNAMKRVGYLKYDVIYRVPIRGKEYTIDTRKATSSEGIVSLTRLDNNQKVDVLSVTGRKNVENSFTAKFVGSSQSVAWFTVEVNAASEAMNSDDSNSWTRQNWSALYVTDGHTARKLAELGRSFGAFDYDVSYTSRSDGSYVFYIKRGDRKSGALYAFNASDELLSRYQLPSDISNIQMHPSLNLVVVDTGEFGEASYKAYTASLPTVACPTVKLKGQTPGSRQVVMECATPGADIYYTTDGKSPSRNSTKYTGPVKLDGSAKLKACAFKKGLLPSICREAAIKAP